MIAVVLLISMPGFSSTSLGYLVDARCFQSEERNVNPDYISVPGARDIDFEIRACVPRANKTKTFMVVLLSGEVLKLDAAGNAQAAKLVKAAGRSGRPQRHFAVNITGTISSGTINVNLIAGVN